MSSSNKALGDFNVRAVTADAYHLVWIDSLADDITLEGLAMDGLVQGPEAVRSIVTFIGQLS